MDPILEAAERKREELREELGKITIFLETYRALKKSLEVDSVNTTGTPAALTEPVETGDNGHKDAAREVEAPDDAPAKRVRVSDNPKPAVVVAATVDLIRQMGKPMSRRDIHVMLKAAGLEVRGADPIKALGTMLWRSGRDVLVQLEGHGYWVKDTPYSGAHYDPDPMFDVAKHVGLRDAH